MSRKKYIAASDIGACAYCPYQHYLRRVVGDSTEVKKRLHQGDIAHEKFNRTLRTYRLWPTLVSLLILVAALLIWRGLS